MSAYLYAAPTGVAGDVTRVDETNVEPAMLVADSTVFAQAYGIPMVSVVGGISQYSAGKVAVDFVGVLIREVPGISGTLLEGLNDYVPYSKMPQGLAVRGYVNVKCVSGTPVRNGQVYIRVVASVGHAVGDFDATSDVDNVVLTSTQATWAADGKDGNNNAELRIAR